MHWDPKVKEQDVWEWPQEVDGFPAGAAAATGSPSGRRGQCTQVTGEQLLLVPTRDSVLVLGERLGTETARQQTAEGSDNICLLHENLQNQRDLMEFCPDSWKFCPNGKPISCLRVSCSGQSASQHVGLPGARSCVKVPERHTGGAPA